MARRLTRGPRRRGRIEDDRILPLINIVFLLLIFFMVVGRLTVSDPFDITPLESRSTGAPAVEVPLVAIGPAGALALDGVLLDEAVLVAQIAELGVTALRIKADQSVEAVRVVGLLTRFKEAGVDQIKLMTVPSLSGAR